MTTKRQRSEPMARAILRAEGIVDKDEQYRAVMREGGWRVFLYARGKGRMMDILEVAKVDGLICQCCYFPPKHGRELTIDHIVPTSQGGVDALDNQALLCFSCNIYKGKSRSIAETRALMDKLGWAYERPADFHDVLRPNRPHTR